MIKKKRVLVCGLGYIGLPSSLILAQSNNFEVIGYDINKKIIDDLRQGKIQFFEPDLDKLFHNLSSKILFSNIPLNADIYLISVPTPFINIKNKIPKPDISYVLDVCKKISPFLKENDLIIIESTCPIGTTEKIKKYISKLKPKIKNIFISYCPERVLPGNIINEIINNNRVVGGIDEKSSKLSAEFYGKFVCGEISLTNSKTAEMVKLVENSYRDVNIAFANEISMIANKYTVNPFELINIANKHPRVNILNPGPGVGGHCIAVDPWFIVDSEPTLSNLIHQGRKVNDRKIKWCINYINRKIKKLNKKVVNVALLGLSYKPNVDDIRESPSIKILNSLKRKANIFLVDPLLKKINEIDVLNDIDQIINDMDLLVILVKHDYFINKRKTLLKNKSKIIDFVGILD